MFLNNTGLLAELECSTNIQRKERGSRVEEFIVGTILECETHEIQKITNEFLRRIHPNGTIRERIQTETLLTSGAKHNGNVVVAWTLGRWEQKISFSSSVTLVVFFNKMTDSVLDFTRCCEM